MPENQITKKENTAIAVVANEMARAQLLWKPKNFDLLIFYHAISQIRKEDKELKEYKTPLSELKEDGKIIKSEYTIIKDSIKRLSRSGLVIEGSKSIKGFGLFASIEYVDGQSYITSKINPELKMFLISLGGIFTMLEMANLVKLSVNYHRQLYIFLKSWIGYPEKEVELKALHKFLQVPKSCETNFYEFKRRILDPAIKELDAKISLTISYEEIYVGRKVEKLKFIFREQLNLPLPQSLIIADRQQIDKCYKLNRKKYEANNNHRCKFKETSSDCKSCKTGFPDCEWIPK